MNTSPTIPKNLRPPHIKSSSIKPSGRRYDSVEGMIRGEMSEKRAKKLIARMGEMEKARMKGMVMWTDANRHCFGTIPYMARINQSDGTFTHMNERVLVLPLNDVEGLVKQISKHLFYNVHLREGNSSAIASSVLAALRVPFTKTRKS